MATMATLDERRDCPVPECTQPVPDGAEYCEAHDLALQPTEPMGAEALLRTRASLAATLTRAADVPARPPVVVLCGSTRFSAAFRAANLAETLAGRIVLTIGCDMRADGELFAPLSEAERQDVKASLDTLHLRKVDLADEVFVLNVGDYIGESTAREVRYARYFHKRIRWLEPHACRPDCPCRVEHVRSQLVVAGESGIPGVLTTGAMQQEAEAARRARVVEECDGYDDGPGWAPNADMLLSDIARVCGYDDKQISDLTRRAEILATECGYSVVEPQHVTRASWHMRREEAQRRDAATGTTRVVS